MIHRPPTERRIDRRAMLAALGGLVAAPSLLRGAARETLRAAWDAADLDGERWLDSAGDRALTVTAGTADELLGHRLVRYGAGGRAELAEPLGDGWTALTVVAYLYLEQPRASWQGIVCRDRTGGAAGDVWSLLVDPDGRFGARATTAAGQVGVLAPATPGWHQVALTYDGASLALVVDGAVVQRAAQAGPLVTEPATPLVLGAYSTGDGPLQGGLSRVELHQAALSEAALAADWAAWQSTAGPITAFTFAQAADTHVTDTKSIEIANDAVDRINADPAVAFSLWLGDMTEHSTPDAMALCRFGLERLGRPHYACRGNHDLRGTAYQDEFGPLMQRFGYGGWEFLICDSNPGDATPMATAQREWLSAQLVEIDRETPLILCCHHPLMPHTKAYLLAEAQQVIGLFDGWTLKAVINGHYHGNQEELVGGVLYTTTACCATTRNNFDGTSAKGYRRFHCEAATVRTEFVPVRETPPA